MTLNDFEMELFRSPLPKPQERHSALFSRLEDPAGGGRGPEPDWSREDFFFFLILTIVLYMHFILPFLPHPVFVFEMPSIFFFFLEMSF